MTERDFCYWLNGFFELNNPKTLNEEQTKLIEQHLDLVFERQIKEHNKSQIKILNIKGPEGYTCSWDQGGLVNYDPYWMQPGVSC